jgi:hypothetical protein
MYLIPHTIRGEFYKEDAIMELKGTGMAGTLESSDAQVTV